MWQVLQQQDMLHYGKLEEFVSLVTEAFPELLSESQRTELNLGLQQSGCKTDPALEVLLWEFLSTLDQLLPVPDLKQTVSWLSAAPSVLEVCLQSVSYPDQLKSLLRHHRSLGQLDMNATLPSIEECKLSSTSCPPSQRAVDSTKLTNTNSQSESITDCMNCLSPASSGEAIKAESVMDSSDYTGVEPRQSFNRCEDIEEKTERKTGYLMSREQKDIQTNMKEEEEDGERKSVKMEGDDGVRDEAGLLKEEERFPKDPSLPVSSLHLLVPPLQLLSAAMWQVLQQQDVLHYGKLEEFVSLVMEAFPELLSESQRTELTLGLQQFSCKTDPALEVLLREFLSTLDQLLPVPDLKQTVSWLSAAPSVLEVCLQAVFYPDQLKTLLRHHRSLGQLDMNGGSLSGHPYKQLPLSYSSDYTGIEPWQSFNRCEDIEEKTERKTGYLMSREQKDILTNMKEEEEDEVNIIVKMEGDDGVSDEAGLLKEEEKERDEQKEGHVTDQVAQTDKLVKNGVISEHRQQEEEELSTLVTSCLLNQPRVLIRRLEIANSSVSLSSACRPVACKEELGARSLWRRHELSPLRGNGSLRQKKGQVMTRKRKTIGQKTHTQKKFGFATRLILKDGAVPSLPVPSNFTGCTVQNSGVQTPRLFSCSKSRWKLLRPKNPCEGSPPLQLPNRDSKDVGCQTVPLAERSQCGTQLSKETLKNHVRDPSLPVSSLHLLVPPLQLLSAAMWQVLQQQDMLHYGKLEEFVFLVTEAFPELLSESQRTELTLGLQYLPPAEIGCKTDPALEVLLWEFLSRLDQLLPVPDLKQTVSWLSAAPSVLEVCLQSVSYPDQLKTLLRHRRSLGQLDMNATLPSIEEYKLSSTSQRMMDSTKLTNTNSQSESITDCRNCLSPASSGEAIKAESVMDSSDYTGVEPRSSLNRCEDIEEKTETKTGYLMSKEQTEMQTNLKEEEDDGERKSVKMEGDDGVRDEAGLLKEEEKERDEQREGHVTDQVAQTDKLVKNGVISEHGQQEGEEPSPLVTSCLLKQPRVLICRLEIDNSSVSLSSACCPMACKGDLRARSPWRRHEPLSLRHKKGQVMTRKRKKISLLERSPKMFPSPSQNRICAEASLISPVNSSWNQNTGSDHTGQSVEMLSQVFGCSQCPFVHTEEVNLHQHIEKTVSWLSAAPSVLEVCVQSGSCLDQLKTLLRHHRSIEQLDMNATLPSIEECKLSSTSRPPSQTMMDSTKMTHTTSQSESITNCMNCLRPASSGEDCVESVMDRSDFTGVEPRSGLNRCEDIEERTERKTGYLMSREQTEILTNMKEEEEDGERQSVKMEGEDGVRDEGHWKEEEKERDDQREEHVTDQAAQSDKWVKNGVKSEHAQQEEEELSTLVTSCLLKQPRVLIRQLEIVNSSVLLSSPPRPLACERGNGSLIPKGQVMTRKRNSTGLMERPLKLSRYSSENGICAEASLISPVNSSWNQNTGSDHTGQTVEMSSQVFACSQCPFVHTKEVNLHQHIEKCCPSVLEVCVQSVSYLDQLKILLRHHRSIEQLDMNATLPSIEECKLSSTSRPPSQTMMDSTKMTNTTSQS
ncbi:hypothetical protein SKAU_G00183430 [Synaphobranchus kaupii]|uniref:TERF1-interacting nuclear factor 2 N-terminal domain-containing protein n=1 Tax=Synaphobranchus kaupii TaxID=118154 RepID=A0A9Q1FCB2_SYNKA|nr:hypothetical protein SKAU_G00183430 [Synaphobranchus kaupii]